MVRVNTDTHTDLDPFLHGEKITHGLHYDRFEAKVWKTLFCISNTLQAESKTFFNVLFSVQKNTKKIIDQGFIISSQGFEIT